MLGALRKANLHLSSKKCDLMRPEINFLGHGGEIAGLMVEAKAYHSQWASLVRCWRGERHVAGSGVRGLAPEGVAGDAWISGNWAVDLKPSLWGDEDTVSNHFHNTTTFEWREPF
ncbi:unnamed protein product [Merluccius merluccius]